MCSTRFKYTPPLRQPLTSSRPWRVGIPGVAARRPSGLTRRGSWPVADGHEPAHPGQPYAWPTRQTSCQGRLEIPERALLNHARPGRQPPELRPGWRSPDDHGPRRSGCNPAIAARNWLVPARYSTQTGHENTARPARPYCPAVRYRRCRILTAANLPASTDSTHDHRFGQSPAVTTSGLTRP
jgi:hypothetical protein